MKELLIQMALDGYRVTFTNAGFTLRDSIEVRVSRIDPYTERYYAKHAICGFREMGHLEDVLRDCRDEVLSQIIGHVSVAKTQEMGLDEGKI